MAFVQQVADRIKSSPKFEPAFESGKSYNDYLTENQNAKKTPKGMQVKDSRSSQRDEWYESAGQFALGRAVDLSERPYEAYGGNRVAGLSANERQASGMARGAFDRVQPYMRRLEGGFSGANISNFMNPYTDKVLESRKRGITDEYGRQMGDISRNQAATDAFRSGRSDLARSRANASKLRALDDATAETEAAAFESAKDSMFRQGAQDLGAIGQISAADSQAQQGLMATGGTERAIDQANRDFDYGQHLERRDWDVNNLNNLISAIQGVNSTAGTTETNYKKKEKKSTWGTILGVVGTAVGAMYGMPQVGGAIGGAVGGAIDG